MTTKWILPYFEIEFTYMRSRGPGGQNVNKTNSACQLRWKITESTAFTPAQLDRVLLRLQRELTEAGEVLIRSDQFRDQEANKKACIDRLIEKIEAALFVQKPRKKTKPKKSAVRKRLKGKELRGEVKALRQRIKA